MRYLTGIVALLGLATVVAAQLPGGGGFGEHPALVVVGATSCTPLTGSVTIFAGPGGCDQDEQMVAAPLRSAATFAALSCRASVAVGGQTITVTGRAGTCGSALADQALACTISTGTPVCASGAAQMLVGAGQCWDVKIVPSGALSTPAGVVCTLEKTG